MDELLADVSRWPIGRYFREVVAAQPDGRVLLFSGMVNWSIAILIACYIVVAPMPERLTWTHVVTFLGMPLVGFVWFVRAMPSFKLTLYEHVLRKPWQRRTETLFQLVPALLPWAVLVETYAR